MFQSGSVNDRFTKVEAGSNISVRLDAGVIERCSEIDFTVAFDGRAAPDYDTSSDLGCRADVTGRLDLRGRIDVSRLVDPDILASLESCGLDPATSLQRIFHQLPIVGGGRKADDIAQKIVSGRGRSPSRLARSWFARMLPAVQQANSKRAMRVKYLCHLASPLGVKTNQIR